MMDAAILQAIADRLRYSAERSEDWGFSSAVNAVAQAIEDALADIAEGET